MYIHRKLSPHEHASPNPVVKCFTNQTQPSDWADSRVPKMLHRVLCTLCKVDARPHMVTPRSKVPWNGKLRAGRNSYPEKNNKKKDFTLLEKLQKKNDNLKQTLSIFKGRKNCKPIIGSASWGSVFLRRRSGIFKEDLNIGFFVILQHDTSKQFVMQKQTTWNVVVVVVVVVVVLVCLSICRSCALLISKSFFLSICRFCAYITIIDIFWEHAGLV